MNTELTLAKSPQGIFKQIFDSEHPEQLVKTISAQTLYLAIRHQGLPSSSEVLELLSPEQMRIVLDFDLWTGDQVEEESLWEWLELPDADNDLTVLQRVLQSMDLKIVALLIHRYLNVVIQEEATDAPPGDGFHSPDKGRTWIRVEHEDSTKEFLMKRLLALIFETKAELFYQMIQIPLVSTESTLEEEAFQDKSKRLMAEGIPDLDWAAELQSARSLEAATRALKEESPRPPIEDILSVPIFSHSHSLPSPLKEFISEVGGHEELEREITLLMNSAFVHFRIPIWNTEDGSFLLTQVRGASNIGLERIMESSPSSSFQSIHQILGFRGIYQVGLESVFSLRSLAQKIPEEKCKDDPRILRLLDGLKQHFPALPAFVADDGSFVEDGDKLKAGFRALETVADVNLSEVLLKKL